MHDTTRPVASWSAVCRCAGVAISALLLTIFAGCAPTTILQDDHPSMEPVVSRLDHSRVGFAIEERVGANGELRKNFDSAVDFIGYARYDEAIALLKLVIAKSPGLTAPHVDIAMAYIQKEEIEKAEEHLKSALELIPGHPIASNVYGLLLRKNGRFTEAREIFETTLDLFPEYLPARRNFGILCELYLGDPTTALEQYEIYSAAVPDDDKVTIWIASLRQRLEGVQ
jgi:tetratricopeptide (TPR) repeat protein